MSYNEIKHSYYDKSLRTYEQNGSVAWSYSDICYILKIKTRAYFWEMMFVSNGKRGNTSLYAFKEGNVKLLTTEGIFKFVQAHGDKIDINWFNKRGLSEILPNVLSEAYNKRDKEYHNVQIEKQKLQDELNVIRKKNYIYKNELMRMEAAIKKVVSDETVRNTDTNERSPSRATA